MGWKRGFLLFCSLTAASCGDDGSRSLTRDPSSNSSQNTNFASPESLHVSLSTKISNIGDRLLTFDISLKNSLDGQLSWKNRFDDDFNIYMGSQKLLMHLDPSTDTYFLIKSPDTEKIVRSLFGSPLRLTKLNEDPKDHNLLDQDLSVPESITDPNFPLPALERRLPISNCSANSGGLASGLHWNSNSPAASQNKFTITFSEAATTLSFTPPDSGYWPVDQKLFETFFTSFQRAAVLNQDVEGNYGADSKVVSLELRRHLQKDTQIKHSLPRTLPIEIDVVENYDGWNLELLGGCK